MEKKQSELEKKLERLEKYEARGRYFESGPSTMVVRTRMCPAM